MLQAPGKNALRKQQYRDKVLHARNASAVPKVEVPSSSTGPSVEIPSSSKGPASSPPVLSGSALDYAQAFATCLRFGHAHVQFLFVIWFLLTN